MVAREPLGVDVGKPWWFDSDHLRGIAASTTWLHDGHLNHSIADTFRSTSSVYDGFDGDPYFPFKIGGSFWGFRKVDCHGIWVFVSLALSLPFIVTLYPFRFLEPRPPLYSPDRQIDALWRMASLPKLVIPFIIPEVDGFVDAGEGSCT